MGAEGARRAARRGVLGDMSPGAPRGRDLDVPGDMSLGPGHEVGARGVSRRALLGLAAAAAAGPLLPGWAEAAAPRTAIDRRVALWRSFAEGNASLVARVTATRHSSLFVDGAPRSLPGRMLFVAPDRLVLRDDDPVGSTTVIDGEGMSITANDPRAAPGPTLSRRSPALAWLARHLVAAFAPGDGAALAADARLALPRAGIALVVLPGVDSPVRRLIRSLTLTLDPDGGAVTEVELLEAQGDRWVLALREHRQGASDAELAGLLGR